jgi:nitroimidazol reductase NimA-like FMN-containing flavoprotein (pyridoxamine 5'-phosphate oxidase superfamily)
MHDARSMTESPTVWQPIAVDRIGSSDAPRPKWLEARWRLEEAQYYWLATVRPDGRPHVMPISAIWLDGALYFCTSPSSRKARSLASIADCVITVDSDDLHLVVEGDATHVSDTATLQRAAAVYESKYGWQVEVQDGALYGDAAPTAGPPPYALYRVMPSVAFAFGTDDSYGASRWEFAR